MQENSRAAFHTLGCKLNQYDTQAMLEKFRQAGYRIVPFEEEAEVYLINTCTVTGEGDRKSLQLARRIRREHPHSALILCGCLAQRKGEELLETGARLVLGTQRRGEVVTLLEKALREDTQICAVEALASAPYEPLTVSTQEERTRAVMKIQEGCENRCTYCIIPSVRGPVRSRPLQEIRDEAVRLAAAGYQEIVLTGIHLSSYGRDLPQRETLLDAVGEVQAVGGIRRIRLGSLEPTIATAAFAEALAGMDKVCPQFHLALQSGSDTVLARMARRYNMKMYREAVACLRATFPRAALTTDILTGFPGETEEEFLETCDAVREIGFARIHVFPYSSREGTRAAQMPGQLSREEKNRRAQELIRIGHECAQRYLASWVGREAEVLLETEEEGSLLGYTPEYIRVAVPAGGKYAGGDAVRVRLCLGSGETMKGDVLGIQSRTV